MRAQLQFIPRIVYKSRMRQSMAILAGCALGLLSLPALSDDGLYVGAGLAQAHSQYGNSLLDVHDTDGAYKLLVGFRPLSVFSAEVNYVDFGNASQNDARAHTRGVDVFAVGYLPIPVVDLYGKVGLINWKSSAGSPTLAFDHSGDDLALGVGAGASWGAFGARLEYERFQIAGTSGENLLSLEALWTFL
jgi:hypothetical protein